MSEPSDSYSTRSCNWHTTEVGLADSRWYCLIQCSRCEREVAGIGYLFKEEFQDDETMCRPARMFDSGQV
jgi:hypothetical protein